MDEGIIEGIIIFALPAAVAYITTLFIHKILKRIVKNTSLLRILSIVIFFALFVVYTTIWFNSPFSPK
jgi:predicted neutral ceramidase superfamily lipid hydrolase